MIGRKIWPLLIMIGTGVQAAAVPLKPGTYVLAGVACDKPAFAAVFTYDGRSFAYPHATHCRSVVRSHVGKTYRVSEVCSASGDGSPSGSSRTDTSYTIKAPGDVLVRKAGEATGGSDYRWCPTPIARAFR